jgi:hypothetical protein
VSFAFSKQGLFLTSLHSLLAFRTLRQRRPSSGFALKDIGPKGVEVSPLLALPTLPGKSAETGSPPFGLTATGRNFKVLT